MVFHDVLLCLSRILDEILSRWWTSSIFISHMLLILINLRNSRHLMIIHSFNLSTSCLFRETTIWIECLLIIILQKDGVIVVKRIEIWLRVILFIWFWWNFAYNSGMPFFGHHIIHGKVIWLIIDFVDVYSGARNHSFGVLPGVVHFFF